MEIALFLLVWFGFGLVGGGFFFANFQGGFPSIAKESFRQDLGSALMWSFLGPLGMIIAFFMSGLGEHGWWIWGRK